MNEIAQKNDIKSLLKNADIQSRFEQLLGKKAQGFISSVLQTAQNNKLLATADAKTILNAAVTAATLDLPINQNLGYAYIVPYKGQAQFQLGWKGFVALAKRSGAYLKMNVVTVYENQFKSYNRLTEELDADFKIEGNGNVVGYAAYFKEVNGFEKLSFWSIEQVKKHATKYSQTYGKKSRSGALMFSPWNDEDQFDAMAMKTVLKNTLSKFGTLSIEMQMAQMADQAVIKNEGEYEYIDNTIDIEAESAEEEANRIIKFIDKANSIEALEELKSSVDENGDLELLAYYDNRKNELK